jgi:hypothetical protein
MTDNSELRSKTNALMNPTVEVTVSGQRIDQDGDPPHKPRSWPLESIAPKPRLAIELRRVAESAQKFIHELTANTNFEVDPRFPKQKLIDVAATLIDLSAASEDGALPALEYAKTALVDMRFSFMEIAEGDLLPDMPRGGRVDQSLVTLISDIGTAKRICLQSKPDAAARTETPDHAVDEIRFEIAGDLEKSTATSRREVERSISRLKVVNGVRIAALPFAAFSAAVAAVTTPIAFPIGAGVAAAAVGIGGFLARRERAKLVASLRDLEARHILNHEEAEQFLATANSMTIAGPAM